MYQWWLGEEQLSLIRESARGLTDAERQRMELLEEIEASKPSLWARIRDAFTARPAPDFRAPVIEAGILGGFVEDGTTRRAA